MTENVNVQYIGFEAKALVREYCFLVRQAGVRALQRQVTSKLPQMPAYQE